MSALTTQLEQLKIQQEELEKRIQEEAETKKKLNNEASIERLEALVEPITENLNYIGPRDNIDRQPRLRNQYIKKHEIALSQYNNRISRKNADLEQEEIYITLIGILKKQDERIKILESK